MLTSPLFTTPALSSIPSSDDLWGIHISLEESILDLDWYVFIQFPKLIEPKNDLAMEFSFTAENRMITMGFPPVLLDPWVNPTFSSGLFLHKLEIFGRRKKGEGWREKDGGGRNER